MVLDQLCVLRTGPIKLLLKKQVPGGQFSPQLLLLVLLSLLFTLVQICPRTRMCGILYKFHSKQPMFNTSCFSNCYLFSQFYIIKRFSNGFRLSRLLSEARLYSFPYLIPIFTIGPLPTKKGIPCESQILASWPRIPEFAMQLDKPELFAA